MDLSTIFGLVICTGLVVVANFSATAAHEFVNWSLISIMAVALVGVTFVRWPFSTIKLFFKFLKRAIFPLKTPLPKTINQMIHLSEIAKKESIEELGKINFEDKFLKKAIDMVLKKKSTEMIIAQLQFDIDAKSSRHQIALNLFQSLSNDIAAIGLIGSLMSFLLMMKGTMAKELALNMVILSALYGTLFSFLLFEPLKNKLASLSVLEINQMSIILAGSMGIVTGESPSLIKEKLDAFLLEKNK